MEDEKIEDLDLYEILGVSINTSTSEIKKAYRKKALECHPDKNPDNPNASKEFHRLSKILEILTDEAARKAYDQVLKARKEAVIRHQELDGKRRKLKEDLVARELAAGRRNTVAKSASEKLLEEIERLRKEGSRQVEEEVANIMRQVQEEKNSECNNDGSNYRIKIKWKATKNDPSNGGYTEEMLQRFLSKYGDISEFVMSKKKTGSALVEFKSQSAAEMAVQLEIGLPSNPLKLQWITEPNANAKSQSTTIKASDYESVILTKLRQAEERKRLIEQMMAEDDREDS